MAMNEPDYLLATDNALVVPVGKTVVLQITAADVIHSWAMPAFAIKQDAVPGRIAQAWFKADWKASISASVRSFAGRRIPTCRSP